MLDLEAKELIETMRDNKVTEVINLKRRIKDLKIDYVVDPHETTAAQIDRLEERLVIRQDEAKALAIAATKF